MEADPAPASLENAARLNPTSKTPMKPPTPMAVGLKASSGRETLQQHVSPSSTVIEMVLLICNGLRFKSGDFLHYILGS